MQFIKRIIQVSHLWLVALFFNNYLLEITQSKRKEKQFLLFYGFRWSHTTCDYYNLGLIINFIKSIYKCIYLYIYIYAYIYIISTVLINDMCQTNWCKFEFGKITRNPKFIKLIFFCISSSIENNYFYLCKKFRQMCHRFCTQVLFDNFYLILIAA